MLFNYKLKIKATSSFFMATLSIICCGTSYAEHDVEELNTLFTGKEQRASIDAARSGNASPQLQKSNKVTIDGYVTRSDGKDVVWLNNRNTLDDSTVGGVKVQQSNIGKNKKVGVTIDGTHVHLKPGETWYKEIGKIVENQ
ncbi:MAG: hypothetical protein KAI17_02490 [Thiotrichaceae bacterium]|nr:hypothetical protein [Thiotrichaceae bacterium]